MKQENQIASDGTIDTIDKSRKYEHNPRTITDRQRELLDEHLREFGDLSGIVYCIKNKAYVCGNQRSDVMDGAQIEIVERHEKPTAQKTVAHGFVHFNDEKFAYREVAFTKDEFQRACIVANNDGGAFDFTMLQTSEEWADVPLVELGLELPPLPSADDLDLSEFFTETDVLEVDNDKIVLEYTKEDCEKVRAALRAHGATFEQAVWKLLAL